jgi:catechol 2,3-dioxygenase-like lactoylglutathione lyase family enzyme
MAIQTVTAGKGLVKTTRFSHGTLECHDLAASRRFYEEFLGLECVRHGKPPAILVRKGSYWALVAVQVGDRVHPQHVLNHWGVDVPSTEEVDRAYQLALQHKDTYGIKKVMPPTTQHGAYSFYLEDRDSNWWEIQYIEESFHDRAYERGDVVPSE